MNLIDEQRELERSMVSKGVNRFYKAMELAEKSNRHFDLAPYNTVLNQMTAALLPHVKQMQSDLEMRITDIMRNGGGRGAHHVALHMVALDPVVISYIVVRTLLQEQGCTTHTLGARIAGVLQMQRQFEIMSKEDRPAINRLKRTVKEINTKSVKKWVRLLNNVTKVEWSWEDRVKIGMNLIHVVERNLQEFVTIKTVRKVSDRRSSFRTEVTFTDDLKKKLREQEEILANEQPWLTPMICPPRSFTQTDNGGYYLIDHDIVKDNYYGVRVDKSITVPQAVCDAVNNLSRVGWMINSKVLAVAKEAIRQGRKELLPVAPLLPLPEPIEDAMWAQMTQEQRGKHKTARRLVHDHNNKLESKRETMRRVIQVADEYQSYDTLYFPHTLDFRGRAYPLPQDLNPQGDDFTRSLLQFSQGKQVDEEAMRWLMHAAAAAYGNDKMSLEEQVEWCEQNSMRILMVVQDPLGASYEFLCEADEPWQFLAACMDIEECWRAWSDGIPHYSHLPVHVDGTCNGLQHLSAMGLDPVGAKAVNLVDGPRQDIYQDVADKVVTSLDPKSPWVGRVTRKTVKRGVMTTPYGVTPEGIRRQLIDDGMLEGVPGDQLENATYMRDRMGEAINDTIVGGKEIMYWMQNVARQLCAENKPVTWTTPIGFVCSQAYRKPNSCRFNTLVGQTRVVVPNPKGELRLSKQVNSIAPNIVHSFDAAHLMMTVNRACPELSVGTVHDSYGTHACDVPKLSRILRETFVEIYSENQLEKLKQSFIQSAGRYEDWMEPPRRGDFDIKEVLSSSYFFF